MTVCGRPLQAVLAFLPLLLALAGCATLPPSRSAAPAIETDGSLFEEWLRASRHHALQGVAKVRVQTPERSLSGTQVLLVSAPDRLRAETLSPFGTPLLVLAVDGDGLAVLLPGENRYYHGRATPENLGRFARLPLHPADLVDLLLFRPPHIAYRSVKSYRLADGGWQVVLGGEQGRQELFFDAGRRLVEVRYLRGEELQLHLTYSDFSESPPAFPRGIELVLPAQQIQASLVFKEFELDRQPSPAAFNLNPPAGATVIDLDDAPAPAGNGNHGAAPAGALPASATEEK